MRAFFDTNVLVYAVTAEPRKRRADQILRAGGVVSVQVLNEFANVAYKKLQHDWTKIAFALDRLKLSFDAIVPLTLDTHTAALILARDNHLPFCDALIVASAIEAGCDTLFTEDMQDGRNIGGLTIVNPFSKTGP